MQLLNRINQLVKNQQFLFGLFLCMLILPNVFMVYTEPTPLLTRVVNVLLPLGAYWLCMSWFRKPGWAFWALFLFIFFDAFDIVLLHLFGEGPVAVDMFLNVATTNVTDSIKAIMSFGQDADPIWYQDGASIYLNARDYYHVINSCNAYIASCDTFRMTGMDQKYMIKEYAQVEAIRAWTYMQLVNAYGTVPFYTKPMLTTDEINKFMKDPNHATVNAQSLADSLAERLLPMEYVEYYYGYPQYENYSNLCHRATPNRARRRLSATMTSSATSMAAPSE